MQIQLEKMAWVLKIHKLQSQNGKKLPLAKKTQPIFVASRGILGLYFNQSLSS